MTTAGKQNILDFNRTPVFYLRGYGICLLYCITTITLITLASPINYRRRVLVYGSAVVYNRVAATRGSRSNSKQHYCITQIAHLVFGFSSVNNSELTRPLRDNPSVVYWYSGVHLDCDKKLFPTA